MKCKFCTRKKESINHLFLECSNTNNIRIMIPEYLEATNTKFDKHRVLRVGNITNIPEVIVISRYKEILWNMRNALMRKEDYNE